MLEGISSATARLVEDTSPAQIASCLYSLATLRLLDKGLLVALLRAARERLPQMGGADAAVMLAALATAGVRPGRCVWKIYYAVPVEDIVPSCKKHKRIMSCHVVVCLVHVYAFN